MSRSTSSRPVAPLVVLLVVLARPAFAASYSIVEKNQGLTFFDNFLFWDNFDNTTQGDVQYVNSSSSPSLAFVNRTTGHAIMRVSDEAVPFNEKRKSVRIDSRQSYDVGTVWVFDAIHVPFGCSVWPAYWSTSLDTLNWPKGGEIDTLEAINRQQTNAYALHSTPGCAPASPAASMSGTVVETICSAASGSGCKVQDQSPLSYGDGFNQAGGGVYITELATTGISIWFYTRASIPSSISSSMTTIDTATLGQPVAFWPSDGCSPIQSFYYAQKTVIDITLCGLFAGVPSQLNDTGCPVPATPSNICYTTFVLNQTAFSEAYWEIAYLSVFSSNPSVSSIAAVPVATETSNSTTSDGARGVTAGPLVWSGGMWVAVAAIAGAAVVRL